jgi:two-component sensor histidine kinase
MRVLTNIFEVAGEIALHELATNAGKYGALSADKGRVDISWGIVGDTFTMSWIEREGPLVSAPQKRGFGTIVRRQWRSAAWTVRSVLIMRPRT